MPKQQRDKREYEAADYAKGCAVLLLLLGAGVALWAFAIWVTVAVVMWAT